MTEKLEYFIIDFTETNRLRQSKVSYIITKDDHISSKFKLNLIISNVSHLERAWSIL